jgi:hypothetical protein
LSCNPSGFPGNARLLSATVKGRGGFRRLDQAEQQRPEKNFLDEHAPLMKGRPNLSMFMVRIPLKGKPGSTGARTRIFISPPRRKSP